MQLTAKLFNGSNFVRWSRFAQRALGAKHKLGFLDGSFPRPEEDSSDLQSWIRCDYMVTCWMVNSRSSDLAEAFMYVHSSKQPWYELSESSGRTSGPLVFQLQKELSNLKQENDSISTYFNKLKRIWDELVAIDGIPSCLCGAITKCKCNLVEKIAAVGGRNKLAQFPMGLNFGYDTVRNQIFSMDPRPGVNRAYYILPQDETQKQITDVINVRNDFVACAIPKPVFRASHPAGRKKI